MPLHDALVPTLRRSLCGAALLVCLAPAPPAGAVDILTDGSFDRGIKGWRVLYESDSGTVAWSQVDVDDAASSGSLLLVNDRPDAIQFVWAYNCLPAEAGAEYAFGLESLVPSGQSPSGDVSSFVRFFDNDTCAFPSLHLVNLDRVRDVGAWIRTDSGPITAPAGSRSVMFGMGVRKTENLPGPVMAHFDDVSVEVDGVIGDPIPGPGPGPDEGPQPPAGGWFTDPSFPGFRFNVLINAGPGERSGTREASCLPETVCVSGALPGRVEILLRIVGPKPNGYLWPTLFKASTSSFDVWIEQLATGTLRHYRLDGAGPGSDELPGLFDREGFLP